tara:strand:+ start:308 stop:460 length:153 start_codon:yes stop_codon:yes gene_type:complete
MPKVDGKEFSYTPAGIRAAAIEMEKKKKKKKKKKTKKKSKKTVKRKRAYA